MTKDEYKVSPLAFPIFVGSVHILVGLTMTLFSEKMLISPICKRGLMPNLIKKSWMVSNARENDNNAASFLNTK